MKEENIKQVEFGKLTIGSKFYMAKPSHLNEDKYHVTITTVKTDSGVWTNAKNNYGLTAFVQYDKRVWIKS
jgi:hypothetical protein